MLSRGLYWVNKRGILPACVVNCVRCLSISLTLRPWFIIAVFSTSSAANDFSFHGFPKDEKLVKVRNVSGFSARESNDTLVPFRLCCFRSVSFFTVVLRFGLRE